MASQDDFHGPERQSGPLGGTPESAAWFKATLAEIGETTGSFAGLMKRYGDDRGEAAIRRSIQRMASGEARVSGEMRALLTVLKRSRARRSRAILSDRPAAARESDGATPLSGR